MAKDKITFEQFLETVDAKDRPFIQSLHSDMLDEGCKVEFEEKKSGMLASYKCGKKKKSVVNLVFRKKGMLVRIYGKHAGEYEGFLNTLPPNMVEAIQTAGECKRLTQNKCSTKCVGYEFTIGDEHFQKCKYNCFEFWVTEENHPFIRAFIGHELDARKE